MAFFDFISNLPTIFQGIQGINQLNQGAILQVQGAEQEAAGLRLSGKAHAAVSEYNQKINQINFQRQIDQTIRDQASFLNTQRLQASSSGLDITSASFLQVMSDTMGVFERQIMQAKLSNKQQQQALQFESELAQVSFENQARLAISKGQRQAFLTRQEAASKRSDFIMNTSSLLLQEFGDFNGSNNQT